MGKTHIAIFPLSVAMGHFLPLAEFTERLCKFDGSFSITFIISKWRWGPQQPLLLQRLASSALHIRFEEIPDVTLHEDEDGDEQPMSDEALVSNFVLETKPHIQQLLQSLHLSLPISAFVTDMFCTDLLDVSQMLNIPSYLFCPASAAVACFMLHLPNLVSETEISLKDADSELEVEIRGLPLISTRDLPTTLHNRSNSACYWLAHHGFRFREASGILINTFAELEEEAMETLRAAGNPGIYPIGPLMLSSDSDAQDESRCLEWLDQQPPSSVLFVAFGSRAILSREQIADLAIGLEGSGHRFLWVVRGYKSGDSNSSLETEISQLLPEGFESRTRDRGLVVLNWVPQVAVLSHPSTGGFLSHCGWNSILESVCHGVPMIAWPQAADQRMNRVILVKQIEVGIDLRMESDGFVRRGEVERAVRELMEGEEGRKAREKMKKLKEEAKIAGMEGGSTVKATSNAATDLSQKPS